LADLSSKQKNGQQNMAQTTLPPSLSAGKVVLSLSTEGKYKEKNVNNLLTAETVTDCEGRSGRGGKCGRGVAAPLAKQAT